MKFRPLTRQGFFGHGVEDLFLLHIVLLRQQQQCVTEIEDQLTVPFVTHLKPGFGRAFSILVLIAECGFRRSDTSFDTSAGGIAGSTEGETSVWWAPGCMQSAARGRCNGWIALRRGVFHFG